MAGLEQSKVFCLARVALSMFFGCREHAFVQAFCLNPLAFPGSLAPSLSYRRHKGNPGNSPLCSEVPIQFAFFSPPLRVFLCLFNIENV